MVFLIFQSLKYLDGKSADQTLRYTLEIVVLDKFIQIYAQAFKSYYQVFSKQHITFDSNDVVGVVFVMMVQIFQDFEFDTCLILELLFIPYYFESHHFFRFVIEAFYCLAEASLAKELQHFVPISKMVFQHNLIIALVIVISMIENAHLLEPSFVPLHLLWWTLFYYVSFYLFPAILAKIVNLVAVG